MRNNSRSTGVNPVSPKKLLHSKWTAVTPENKDKHFIVTDVELDEEERVVACVIEAIMSQKTNCIDWRELKRRDIWQQGWQ